MASARPKPGTRKGSGFLPFTVRPLQVKLEFYYTVSGSNTEANTVGQLQTTITEHGLCYAFNSDIAIYNSPEWVTRWPAPRATGLPPL